MAELPADLEQAELKKRAMRRLAVAIALVAAAVAVLVMLGRDKPAKPAVAERPTPEIAPPFIVPPPPPTDTPPLEPPQQPAATPEPLPQQAAPAEQLPPSVSAQAASKPQAALPPPPEVVSKPLPKPGAGPASSMPPATRPATAAQALPAQAAPVEKPPLTAKAAEAPPAKGYVVQLGVFTNYANARQLQERLAQNGIKSYTETRVHVGPFRDKAEAEQAYAKIKALGISAVVVAH